MSADLIVLAADKNTEHGLRGLLNRPRALGIRSINFRIYGLALLQCTSAWVPRSASRGASILRSTDSARP